MELKMFNKNGGERTNFTMAPNALWRLYTRLPGFKATHIATYLVLADYYNENEGYAYPKNLDLQLRLGISENTVTRALKILEKYNLLSYEKLHGRNNIYFVYMPIENEDDFYNAFPEAQALHREKSSKLYTHAQEDKIRLKDATTKTYQEDPIF